MLPPMIGNINSDILTLYTMPAGNNGSDSINGGGNGRPARGRYAEIGVIRSELFLEPYPQEQQQQHRPQQQQQQQQQQLSHTRATTPAPSNPPPEPLRHRLRHVQSERSLSSEGSAMSVGDDTSDSSAEEDSVGGVDDEVACSITLAERLIRSHPIWFLPGIQRSGAFHLLQGQEEGNFVVRQSSQKDTMALTVRLPEGRGPYIEHYLILSNNGKLSLETSDNTFDDIPSLITHYAQCCDELPVQLTLPKDFREARNRRKMSSLALLGQEFWNRTQEKKKPSEHSVDSASSNTSSLSSFLGGVNNNNNINSASAPKVDNIILNLAPISTRDSPNTSPSNTNLQLNNKIPRQTRPTPPNTLNLTSFNEPLNTRFSIPKLSPNDKLSQRLISPNLVQSLVRSPSPIVHNVDSNVLSSFNDTKSHSDFVRGSHFTSSNLSMTSNFHRNIATGFNELAIRASPDVVHTPNSNHLKSPPPPPPRWAKPVQIQNSFTPVTTAISFNVNQNGDLSTAQSASSNSNTPILISPQSTSSKSLASNLSNKSSSTPTSSIVLSPTTPILSATSKILSNGIRTPQVLSPSTLSSTGKPSRRKREREAKKNSQHYQESDIMESYYRSSPADKISDYEDIWNTTDQSNHSTWSPKDSGSKSSTNSDESVNRHMITSNKERILTPAENRCIADKFIRNDQQKQQQLITRVNEKLMIRKDKNSAGEKLSYKEIMSPEFSSFKPLQDMKSPESISTSDEIAIGKRPDLLSRVCSANSLNSPNMSTPPRTKFNTVLMARSESNSPMTPDSKYSSPFYAEPADAIPRPTLGALVTRRRPKPLNPVASRFRHSEPGWLQQNHVVGGCNFGNNGLHPIGWDETEETEDKIPLISSSVDNLAKRLSGKETKKCLPCAAKPVQPPKINPKVFSDTSWALDTSWEFFSKDADDCEPDYDCDRIYDPDNVGRKFPGEEQNKQIVKNKLTVQSIILQRYPNLLKPRETSEKVYSDRNSSYDNVERRHEDCTSHTMTTTSTIMTNLTTTALSADTRNELNCYEASEPETQLDTDDSDAEIVRSRSSEDQIFASPKHNREIGGFPGDAGLAVRDYVVQLASDNTTTFSQSIENFIQCTKESKETSPYVVMRNMRQFMSGMKNYLCKNGEQGFTEEVQKESWKLKSTEFLNIDFILETAMMQLVVGPLREHVYRLFVEHHATHGSIQTFVENIQLVRSKQLHELGVRNIIAPPSKESLEQIYKFIEDLQTADSPLDKLENLLSVVNAIIGSVKHAKTGKGVTLAADDLIPLLVWVMAEGKFVDAEIEAEYIWGLVLPSMLIGESGYFLTTLSSAVHIIKTFNSSHGTMSPINGCGTPNCSSILRVLVPDEIHGSLNTRTLPVRPNMNTRDICRILAHKIRCTNPQDYGLFKLVQGEETLLGDHECPQELLQCLFVFKRIDAKIAWPKTASWTGAITNGSTTVS